MRRCRARATMVISVLPCMSTLFDPLTGAGSVFSWGWLTRFVFEVLRLPERPPPAPMAEPDADSRPEAYCF